MKILTFFYQTPTVNLNMDIL